MNSLLTKIQLYWVLHTLERLKISTVVFSLPCWANFFPNNSVNSSFHMLKPEAVQRWKWNFWSRSVECTIFCNHWVSIYEFAKFYNKIAETFESPCSIIFSTIQTNDDEKTRVQRNMSWKQSDRKEHRCWGNDEDCRKFSVIMWHKVEWDLARKKPGLKEETSAQMYIHHKSHIVFFLLLFSISQMSIKKAIHWNVAS